MSRPASEYTQAIRNLLDNNPDLTHAEARPLLADLGFEIAVEPPIKSEAYGQFEQYECDLEDEASVASVMTACNFDEKTQKLVLREARLRADFKTESNNFNVTKYNWSKARESSTVTTSRKPVTSRNNKAKVASGKTAVTKLPRPKHRRSNVAVTDDPLELVKANGGVAAVEAKIAGMRAEIEKLEAAVKSVKELQRRLAAAA